MSEALTSYEVTYILGESATEADATAKLASITKLIEAAGGTVSKHELWGQRELAYRIKKNLSGFYVTLWATLPGAAVNSFERELRLDESILRHLVTKAYTTAQPGSLYPVKEEEERKDRRGRRGEGEAASAEEELRRSGSTKSSKKAAVETLEEELDESTEEERQAKLDAALDSLLSDAATTPEDTEDTSAA